MTETLQVFWIWCMLPCTVQTAVHKERNSSSASYKYFGRSTTPAWPLETRVRAYHVWSFYTSWAIKRATIVFDYNSEVSWSIFILFVPVEIERNTLQVSYLLVWWRYNCITSHVTKFTSYSYVKIKYLEFEDKPKFFIKNLWECENFSWWRRIKEFPTKNWKRSTTGRLSAHVANNQFDRTLLTNLLQNEPF